MTPTKTPSVQLLPMAEYISSAKTTDEIAAPALYLDRLIDDLLMPPSARTDRDLQALHKRAAEMLHLMRRAQPAAPALVPLSEREIVKCIADSGCIGTVKMSFESGPYDIDRPSLNATKLVDVVTASLARINGLTVGAGTVDSINPVNHEQAK